MGNTLLSPEASSEILNKYWQPIGHGLYRNRATQEVIREKKMTFRTEDEMKYVFNCLLKRMNNYHTGVVKIVYLRKMTESMPLCECGKKFVILVYVECVGKRLKEFVQQEDMKIGAKRQTIRSTYKCVCMNLMKAAQHLKERYGAFRVTENNVWINGSKNYAQFKPQPNNMQSQTRSEYVYSMVIKLWISSEEQQNFPDESCQEKQMVLSIVQLIQHTLLPSKLCICYSSPQVLDKYLAVHRLKELVEKVIQDHEGEGETATIAKTLSNVQVINKQPAHFQRTIRSFSSNQPGHYQSHSHTSHQNINENAQLAAQRKYTSIEYVRKQPVQYNSAVSQKKVSKGPQVIPQVSQFFSPTAKPLLMQQHPPKHHSFQHTKTYQNPIKNDHSLTKNQYKAMVKFQIPTNQQQSYHTQKPQPYTQQKPIQPFNPKLKYRHGNSIYSRPIIGIADLSGEVSTNIPSITISSQHLTPKQETTLKSQSPSVVNQIPTDRENVLKQDSKVSKINLQVDLSKRHVEISLDKGTNPTDRSKIQISSKSEQKKQPEAINSSRKNISIIPISLDSTNGVAQSHKPLLHSQEHFHKPLSTPVSGQLEMPHIKQSSIHPDKSKKQSASSSKSQRNYATYHINLLGSSNKVKEDMGIKKLLSNGLEAQATKNKAQEIGNSQGQRQKSYSFVNKIENLALATSNGDLGRLRQSEYIASGQNSLMNSKSISINESKPLKQEQGLQIGSLQQMQAKFPTLRDLQNYEDIGIQRSQSHIFVDQEENNSNKPKATNSQNQRDPQIMISYTKALNPVTPNPSHQSSFISNKKSTFIQQSKLKSQSFSSTNNNPRAPVPTEQLQHIINDKKSSMILKDQTLQMQKVTEQEYRVKISTGSEREKMHQKKMSNPTFDKQYMKNKALKEEFSNLLGGEPKQNSLKALTESKDKLVNLDKNEGRETYSIYNESQYNTSEQQSKRQSQHEKMAGSGSAHPPLPGKQHGKQTKWRKPFSKQQLQKELQQKKEAPKSPPNQQVLRLTSSGHEDNSIKQKVRNKKAEFAQLKNQMNSLLL